MSLDDFMKNKKFTDIFDMSNEKDFNFVKKWLLTYKPKWNDVDGWLYVYYR